MIVFYDFQVLLTFLVVTVNCGLLTVEQINELKAKKAAAVSQMTETILKNKEAFQKQKLAQINDYVAKIKNLKYG